MWPGLPFVFINFFLLLLIGEVLKHYMINSSISTKRSIKSISSGEALWKSWEIQYSAALYWRAHKIQVMLIKCDFLASHSFLTFTVDKRKALVTGILSHACLWHVVYVIFVMRNILPIFMRICIMLWNIMPWNLLLLRSMSPPEPHTSMSYKSSRSGACVAASHYFSSADTTVSQTVIDIMGLSSSTTAMQSIVLLW